MKKGKIYHHASTSKRELFAVEQDDLPGPSDYNPPITFADHPSGSPFRSKLPRFPVTKHSFPASNQYLGHSDFIKKTFNKLFSS
ncbi:hypothetical protein HMI54_007748 [Coelomomyces lativittatus]|nr:hypothetical protein HMI56_002092 [Coelomomyces lativittatus]KAJ1516914.1 hypothetical protein HMI54_007748 [Coelomomyces lativittatus]